MSENNFTPTDLSKTAGLVEQNPSNITHLMAQARQINHANTVLKKLLPSPFAGQLLLLNIEGQEAIFGAKNQAIVFRATQQQAMLLDIIQQHSLFAAINSLKIVKKTLTN